MLNHFPVIGGIYDTSIPKTIMTGESLCYKQILVYRLESIVKYTQNTLHTIATNHVPKVRYAWDQTEIYKVGSIL